MEERLNELEIRYDYQARQLESLSQALFEQQRTMDRLVARVEAAERRVAELIGMLDSGPTNENPPHY